MRHQYITLMLFIAMLLSCFSASGEDNQADTRVTCQYILKHLAERKNKDLNKYISYLASKLDKSPFSDKEIDRIIEKLLEIQKSDPYQVMFSFKGGKSLIYPNRSATRQCIFSFEYHKIAKRLRALPMEKRIAKIVEGMINPPKLKYDTTSSFARELVIAGKEAVPFIIRHKPKEPYIRRKIVWALAKIGDTRSIPYIIEVLETKSDNFRFARPDAAEALARFKGDKVISALISTLKDQTFDDIDRHMPQVDFPGHKPYIGRYYSVQHTASQSLTKITGQDWGLLYNEDHKTWSAWFKAGKKGSFDPKSVERNTKEIGTLIEFLFHRYMSARPNPWQPQNVLATAEGIKLITEDLKQLGKPVVPIILKVYEERTAKTPLWRDELRKWTKKLLMSLPWDEANKAAEIIGKKDLQGIYDAAINHAPIPV